MSFDKVARAVVLKCMGIKKGERVLVLTDKLRKNIANAICDAASKITETKLIIKPVGNVDGEELPEDVAKKIKGFDVIIAPTTFSVSHTSAMVAARKHGARVATLPGINEEMFLRAVDVDYDRLRVITKSAADKFTNASNVRVTSDLGTDIAFSIKGRTAIQSNGIAHDKGKLVNLPDGELSFAPVEGSASGIIVIDGSMAPDQGGDAIARIKSPIKLTVENGRAVKIEGKEQANILKKLLAAADKNATNLGEFAVGTNPNARLTGNVLEDEKVAGTVHFALGSSTSFGGNVQSNIHLDGVVLHPVIYVDGKKIEMPQAKI